jgi:uncharacterized coiled-coil DUF342 family protein
MNRAINVLVVMVAAVLGLWGCAQGGGSSHEKVRALESKCAKLEDDYRAVALARDQLRKKLGLVEEERNELRKEAELVQTVIKERDDLRTQLVARIGERDQLQIQFDQLRKGIRSLLGQAEAMTPATPRIGVAETGSPGNL